MVRIVQAADPECGEAAAIVLRRGGLIIYPTDTVYGLGALAADDRAVERLLGVKGRASGKALPLLLADPADVETVASAVPEAGAVLIERFWPGGLTLVLEKSPRFRSLALAGSDSVAVRIPDDPTLREVIRLAGGPITGTSANRSGSPSARTAAEAIERLGDSVDLVIDGGPCRGGVESTVVDVTDKGPRILREGIVSREAVEEALGMRLAVSRYR